MAKTILITGGASGMGLLAGQLYAKEGYNVALVDINKEALDKCVAEIAAYPANVIGIAIDIRDYKKVEEARDRTVEAFGSIDILINFAGGAETRICGASGAFFDIPIEVYDFGIDVNLKGAIYFDHRWRSRSPASSFTSARSQARRAAGAISLTRRRSRR